jgi:PAS domain S-box-containing protein
VNLHEPIARDIPVESGPIDADAARQRLEAICNNASVALIIMNAQQHCIYMNAAAAALTGFTLDEMQGRPLHDFVHHTRPDGSPYPLSECPIDRAFPENNQERGEEVFVHKDGHFYDVAFTASPIRQQDVIVGTIIEVQDITARKRAEQALRDSERRFRHLAEAMPQLITVANADGSIEYFNARAREYDGIALQEDGTWAWQPFVHPDDVAQTSAAWRQADADQQPFEIKHRARMADGSYRWHLSRAVPIERDGRVERWFGTTTDIHEVVLADEAVRRTADADAFRLLLADRIRALSTPAAIRSEAARVLGQHLGATRVHYADVVGAGAERGVVREDYCDGVPSVVGTHVLDEYGQATMREVRSGRTLVIPDAKHDARLRDAERARTLALGVAAYVMVPLMKDGRPIALLVVDQSAPRDWSPLEIALIEETADRTWEAVERARAEEALRAANARLLEQDRQKDEFLAMLAHELRNPLAAIDYAVRLLEPAAGDEQRVFVDILMRQTGTLKGLVDDLLDVSRITRGMVELKQQRVDLVAIAARCLDSVKAAAEDKQHTMTVDLPGHPVEVTGDPLRLEQVLVNILGNAVKYTRACGQIWLGVTVHGDVAVISIRDNGIGLTQKDLGRVFLLFGQAERTLDRSQGGLGLGLTIAKRLVELHGGTISARSEGLGQGSEFVVELPLAALDAPMLATASPSTTPVRARSVLLVEDNADLAATLARLLQEAGHTVHVAHDGPSALRTAQRVDPELVLLDIGLPGLDGYEVARHLRQSPRTRDATLVALTGYGQASDKDQALRAGFDAHFVKPVDVGALNAFLEGTARK